MAQFSAPDVRFHRSFLAAIAELTAGSVRLGVSTRGAVERHGAHWHEPEGFAAYVEETAAHARGEGLPEGLDVPYTTLWWTEGDSYLGSLYIRHRLTPGLREAGGHIGYTVRPAVRRRGHATAMLRASLPYAHRLGIASVLVTCDAANTASRRVIEACGGRFDDERDKVRRYWIRTGG